MEPQSTAPDNAPETFSAILDTPPPGWGYVLQTTIHESQEVTQVILVKQEPNSFVTQQLEELGIGTSDGVLGTLLALIVLWSRISRLLPNLLHDRLPTALQSDERKRSDESG